MSNIPLQKSSTSVSEAGVLYGIDTANTSMVRAMRVDSSGMLQTSRAPSEEYGIPATARQLAATANSENTPLTVSIRRISIFANGGNIRYSVGSTAQTATSNSHYIAQNERLVVGVPATPHIAIIRADSTDCVLELTELS